ncbi:hypothetical protein [Hoeflea poritis]|uniref:Uncharacterized protein n=1 Tax=Hoeflea poritis TaxID=2993659 RepID=A0ABT4VGY9_9HYPH|nr:hypothetical protein [Hoeflea poritis]MDA4843964.1 hypothetical protein [Hoeflea poritis]
MSKRVLLTFADNGLRANLQRLERQAVEMDVFDRVFIRTEDDLSANFRREFKDKLVTGTRGYGYWSWKPQIILQTFDEMDEGDALLYLDAGCHLNAHGRKRMQDYFERVNAASSGILAFQAIPPGGPLLRDEVKFNKLMEAVWTKGDLIDHFGVRDNEDVLNTPSIASGAIFFRKCPASVALVSKWRSVFSQDFSLVDDTPSRSPNYPDFIEHRHDQACFSILCKLAEVDRISVYETWYPKPASSEDGSDGVDWEALRDYPIHAKRDKPRSRMSRRRISIRKRLSALSGYLTNSSNR